jgi:hypothetical protein
MRKIIAIFIMFITIGLVSSNSGIAETTDKGNSQSSMQAPAAMGDTSPAGTFKHEAVAKHIRAEFKIMSLASMNMKDPNGTTHHLMVNLFNESTNHPIKDVVGKVKIIDPDEKEQTNTLKNYNGTFAANFTFSKNGKYGVICLVKIGDQKLLYKFWYQHG